MGFTVVIGSVIKNSVHSFRWIAVARLARIHGGTCPLDCSLIRYPKLSLNSSKKKPFYLIIISVGLSGRAQPGCSCIRPGLLRSSARRIRLGEERVEDARHAA